MLIEIAIPSVVVLVGVSGAGKSTFAEKWFESTEVLSSDRCRALVSDTENDQSATQDAFTLLMKIAHLRLNRRKLCVIDATNTTPYERLKFVRLANDHDCGVSAIVFRTALAACLERTWMRRDRDIQEPAVIRQHKALMTHLPALRLEGFAPVWSLTEDVIAAGLEIRRV